jgi:hypothetical protein
VSDIKPIKPSPALISATRRALNILAPHWSTKFKFLSGSSEADNAMLEAYASACSYAHIDFLEQAARTWVVNSRFAPTPAEFGEYAREATPFPQLTVTSAHEPPPVSTAKHGRQIDHLNALAKDLLRSHGHTRFVVPISQCWALLLEVQDRPERTGVVVSGDVPDDVWLETVRAWIKGARPKGNPMNNLGLNQRLA